MRISDWSSDVCSSDLEAVAVLDDLRGLLEDRHDLLDADHLALGDRGDHDTGRGGADGARQNALGEADEAGLGVAQLGDVEAVGAAIVGEGTPRAPQAQARKSAVEGKGVSVRVETGGR